MKLEETAQLIEDLQKAQNDRLRQPSQPHPPHAPLPTEEEMQLADCITKNLTDLAKAVTPGSLVSEEALHKAMGVDLESATFKYNPPEIDQQHQFNLSFSESAMDVTDNIDLKPESKIVI